MHRLRHLSARLAAGTALFLSLACNAVGAEKPPKDGTGDAVYGTTPWGGLNWGIGISLSADIGRQSHVVTATNVGGIVRVQETQDVIVGFVLEAHYFFVEPYNWPRNRYWSTRWGTGPFVAIEAGGTSSGAGQGPISAYALGWMIGWKEPSGFQPDGQPIYKGNASWNIGLGLRVDPRAKVLGDSIVANQPVPVTETGTEIRLKTSPRYGIMVLSSFSF